MESISGFVEQIIFNNAENGYTVFSLSTDEGEVTCVGNLRYLDEGEGIEVKGEYCMHPVYGTQFNVREHIIKKPDDVVSIERYLASGAIKGIGPAMAGRIIKEFGEDTFRVLEEEPERLVTVKGISENKAREIAISVSEKRDFRKVMLILQDYGITLNLANKIFDRYGLGTLEIIQENPYVLADEIAGVGFKTADGIASKIGISLESDYRIRSGILYCMQNFISDGHVFAPKDILVEYAAELLDVRNEQIEVNLMNLMVENKLVIREEENETRVYPNAFYHMEISVARKLLDLSASLENSQNSYSDEIDALSGDLNIVLDDLQKEAVEKAITNGVVIITGGPGTGKTTTINTIIRYFESRSFDFYLAAPTGRAAKRMTEATGYEASTIQRMLKVMPTGDLNSARGFIYEKNADNPLEADAIIIDEMSMVDITLFNSLLKAVSLGTRLILVGDIYQLPSVGPGAVLKDIILSGAFPVVELKKIFRQAHTSDIVMNAHKINRGEHLLLNNKSTDFFYLKRDDTTQIINNILYLVGEKLPRYVEAKPFDIQVLTPMKKGSLGVSRLNPVLQGYLNPKSDKKAEKMYGDTVFRVGDKVMQTKNNYNLEWEIKSKNGILIESGTGVFNGDMGIIMDIDSRAETVTIEYDESRKVDYPFSLLDEIELAYAVTIHKSQGSEYPAVIIPILSGPKLLFNRNLLYTGVTRAKRAVVLIGSKEQINVMIDNYDEQKRFTTLSKRITELATS